MAQAAVPNAKEPDTSPIPESVTQIAIRTNASHVRTLEYAALVAARDNAEATSLTIRKHQQKPMHELNHTYLTRSTLINSAIGAYREWIEERLGISMADAVVFETALSFYNAALSRLLGYSDRYAPVSTPMARLAERLQSIDVPPLHVPHIELSRERAVRNPLKQAIHRAEESCAYSMNLVDCPVLLQVRDLAHSFVALGVKYHPGPYSSCEREQDVVVISRAGVEGFIALLKALTTTDGKARLQVGCEEAQILGKCDWDQLVLDPSIISLLKIDFESFFQREDWFRDMRLPYRRGYLLHGPPGNGKTTAIRAMLTSRGLTAYTLRLFDEDVDDEDLEHVFRRAAQEAPSVFLLEDIDRGFPRSGEKQDKGEPATATKLSRWGSHR
jgi:ATPase family associated with various cellular activities (AAA)